MKRYLWWSGGILVVLVLLIIFAGGIYHKHVLCEQYLRMQGYALTAPETTATEIAPDWYLLAECQGVQSSLSTAYYFIALGVALIGAGFIRR